MVAFRIVEQAAAVRRHAAQGQQVVDAGAAPGPAMQQVRLAVVVPQRGRVDDALAGQEQMRFAPRSREALGGDDENAEVRVRIEDPELAVVPAQAGRPHAVAEARHGEALGRHQRGSAWPTSSQFTMSFDCSNGSPGALLKLDEVM
jgi:hypothetical protein